MMKTYTDSSSQTYQIDPNRHLKNYGSLRTVSNGGVQTEPCNLEDCTHRERVDVKEDSESDDSSSSSSSSFDQEQELQRRLNPTRPEDFDTLQEELLQWRRREERKILITARNEGHRQEMKKLLLRREAHLLRKIDQLKNTATDKWKTERIEHMMDMVSQPKQWEVSDGLVIGVDTPETCRAREMKALYEQLNEKVAKDEARIKVLQRIKVLVQNNDHCALSKDVIGLLDRELQMLNRGTELGPEFMDAMRKRLSNQFTKLVTRLNADANDSTTQTTTPKFQLHKPDSMS